MDGLTELGMLELNLYRYNFGNAFQREEAGHWLHKFHVKYGTVDPVAFKNLVR